MTTYRVTATGADALRRHRSNRCNAFGVCCCKHHSPDWQRPTHWTAQEVAYLDAHFGTLPDEQIAAHLGRTVTGVRLKAKRMGRRKRHVGLSARAAGLIFGVDAKVISRWLQLGLLRGRQTYYIGNNRRWLVDEPSVVALITDHGEYVDVDKMPDSYYRDLALRQRWYAVPEVERLTGREACSLRKALDAGGYPEARRRYGTWWYLPAASLPALSATARHRPGPTLEARRKRRLLARKRQRVGLAS